MDTPTAGAHHYRLDATLNHESGPCMKEATAMMNCIATYQTDTSQCRKFVREFDTCVAKAVRWSTSLPRRRAACSPRCALLRSTHAAPEMRTQLILAHSGGQLAGAWVWPRPIVCVPAGAVRDAPSPPHVDTCDRRSAAGATSRR